MKKYIIPNLKNACRVMKYLADCEDGASIGTITKDMEIPRTTVLRILTTLKSEDLVTESENKNFTLGGALIQLGLNAMNQLDLQSLARPILKELSIETQETSHLAVPTGYNTLIQDVYDSPNPVRAASRPGAIAPLYCSSTGKLFLAYNLADKVDEIYSSMPIVPLTPKTARNIDMVKENMSATLAKGYGLDDEEYSIGVRCLAAPIVDARGKVVAAIGITASTSTFTKKKMPIIAKQVKNAAAKVSALLGASN